MLKKIFIVLGIIALVIAMLGFFGYKYLLSMMDQVRLQYDKEVISSEKRPLDFTAFELESFNRYDEIHGMITGQTIEVVQSYIMEGRFTVVELCQYYLMRIEKHAEYNAVIQLNPNILIEARLLDEKIKSGEVASLFGTIVLIKDNIAAVNMNTAAGAYALKDLTTSRDAHIVKTLKAQDALIIGKANLSEWSNFMSMPSSSGFSMLGGQTKNAYGKYDVGGSSAGSSVATALNLSTVTLGTETAGSLIFPAGQNSVVALKPTIGLLSRDLIVPIAEAQDTAGVIARNVSDLTLVFNAMLKEDSNDHKTAVIAEYVSEFIFDKRILEGKTLGLYDNGSEEMKHIVSEFEALGARVITITLEKEAHKVDMMSVLNHGIINDVNAFLSNPAISSKYKTMEEIIEFYNNNEEYMPFGNLLHREALDFEGDVNVIIERNQSITRDALDKVLKEVDAIISMSNELSAVYAPAGYPALTIPSGYRDNGEPYGVTLVAGYLEDQKLLSFGYAYEAHTKHRKEVE